MAVQGSEWIPGAIVPHLAVRDLEEAVDFYQRALDAVATIWQRAIYWRAEPG